MITEDGKGAILQRVDQIIKLPNDECNEKWMLLYHECLHTLYQTNKIEPTTFTTYLAETVQQQQMRLQELAHVNIDNFY